jgi:hypothetical protein
MIGREAEVVYSRATSITAAQKSRKSALVSIPACFASRSLEGVRTRWLRAVFSQCREEQLIEAGDLLNERVGLVVQDLITRNLAVQDVSADVAFAEEQERRVRRIVAPCFVRLDDALNEHIRAPGNYGWFRCVDDQSVRVEAVYVVEEASVLDRKLASESLSSAAKDRLDLLAGSSGLKVQPISELPFHVLVKQVLVDQPKESRRFGERISLAAAAPVRRPY